jgi:RimJ/RimL family protein N-acetyltransferase
MKLGYRPVMIGDAEIMATNRNRCYECFFTDHEVSLKETEEWIESIMEREDDHTVMIIDCDLLLPIAQFGVYDIIQGETAELGRILKYTDDRKYKDGIKKIITEVMERLVRSNKLKSIFAKAKTVNEKSLHFLRALGFEIVEEKTSDKGFDYYEMRRGYED